MKIHRKLWKHVDATPVKSTFQQKQELANPARYYGDGGTIHHTGHVDVEIGPDGHVVALWFRCQVLPFVEHHVDQRRADELTGLSAHGTLTGVEILDETE